MLLYATNTSMTMILALDLSKKPKNNVSLPYKILFTTSLHRLLFVHSSINTTCFAWLIIVPKNLPSLVTSAICQEAIISVN